MFYRECEYGNDQEVYRRAGVRKSYSSPTLKTSGFSTQTQIKVRIGAMEDFTDGNEGRREKVIEMLLIFANHRV